MPDYAMSVIVHLVLMYQKDRKHCLFHVRLLVFRFKFGRSKFSVLVKTTRSTFHLTLLSGQLSFTKTEHSRLLLFHQAICVIVKAYKIPDD